MEHVENKKNVMINFKVISMRCTSLNVSVFFALFISLDFKQTYLIRIVCVTMLTDLHNHLRRRLRQTRKITSTVNKSYTAYLSRNWINKLQRFTRLQDQTTEQIKLIILLSGSNKKSIPIQPRLFYKIKTTETS